MKLSSLFSVDSMTSDVRLSSKMSADYCQQSFDPSGGSVAAGVSFLHCRMLLKDFCGGFSSFPAVFHLVYRLIHSHDLLYAWVVENGFIGQKCCAADNMCVGCF